MSLVSVKSMIIICHCISVSDAFLPHLETLLISQRAEEHRPLLQLCIHYIRSVQKDGSDDEHMDTSHSQPYEQSSPSSSATTEADERHRRAQKNREQAMKRIADMQKSFLKKYKEELDEIDYVAETNMYVHLFRFSSLKAVDVSGLQCLLCAIHLHISLEFMIEDLLFSSLQANIICFGESA